MFFCTPVHWSNKLERPSRRSSAGSRRARSVLTTTVISRKYVEFALLEGIARSVIDLFIWFHSKFERIRSEEKYLNLHRSRFYVCAHVCIRVSQGIVQLVWPAGGGGGVGWNWLRWVSSFVRNICAYSVSLVLIRLASSNSNSSNRSAQAARSGKCWQSGMFRNS